MNVNAAEAAVEVTAPSQIPSDGHCLVKSSRARWARKGFVIDCGCSKRWGKMLEVKTPCCGAVMRRNIALGDLVKCRGCDWTYRVYVFMSSGLTRWVSCGH